MVPYVDRLEIWAPDDTGRYSPVSALVCAPLSATSDLSFALPDPHEAPSPSTLDLYLRHGRRWSGFRRSGPGELSFQHRVAIVEPEVNPQFLSLGSRFESGSIVRDLNGDGAIDLALWENTGGVSQPACNVSVYFGPLNRELPAQPHAHVSVEGVAGYPDFADLTGDGKEDMIVCAVEVGTLAMAKTFVMKKLNPYLLAFRQRPNNSFSVAPDARLKFEYRLDLDMLTRDGPPLFWPAGDLSGDGLSEVCVQTGSGRIHIHRPQATGMLPEGGYLRMDCPDVTTLQKADLTGNGRTDYLLWHHGSDTDHAVTILFAP